jgi:hypothetical protein
MTERWVKIKKLYGFSKPYDFNVAIPALLTAAFVFLFLLVTLYGIVVRGNLTLHSERFLFDLYILIGAALIFLAIGRLKIFWPLFVWFLIEFSLGSWAKGLAPFDAGNEFTSNFRYHPLLQSAPVPDFRGSNARLTIVHNSLGMRDTGNPISPLKREGLIFVFGGSTTYDTTVTQGHTWVETLNKNIGPNYKLFNLGSPGYSTAEHVIQTAFYGDISGVYPSCAIYYIGWNDIRNANLADLDRAYANFHLLTQINNTRVRRTQNMATISPILKFVLKQMGSFLDTLPYPSPRMDKAAAEDGNQKLKWIYQRNIATITAINESRGVKTIIVGQMLNRDKIRAGVGHKQSHGWLPFVDDGDVWKLQSEFNDLVKNNADKVGYRYIDADIDKFDPTDFVDSGHFTASGAEKFASRISDQVRRACPSS